ncbi:polyprenyl synthetase family protein, partial [Crocinitomicaceae bacterium]|nr:polyprenyl synthetase family protein [Crocinitomicaceae bacterium]
GKPTGNDIREQKMTLPLIYTLNNCEPSIKKELINIVKNQNEDSKAVKRAIQLVIDGGGIQYAHKVMTDYKERALKLIEDVPSSSAKESLIGLVEYTTNRLS